MESRSSLGSGQRNALTLAWAYGFNKDLVDGVVSLSGQGRDSVLYVAAHTGVIYDRDKRTQRLLQGHSNPITAVATSGSKRWIVTADAGPDSLLVVWDSLTGTPVKTFFNPHPGGCVALDMTPDGSMVATLSAPDFTGQEPQVVSLWQWGASGEASNGPVFTSVIEDPDMQKRVKFNPIDVQQLMTCGDRRTLFWSWPQQDARDVGTFSTDGLRGYAPRANRQGMKQAQGLVTGCCFLPGTSQAITTTDMGEVVLWDAAGGDELDAHRVEVGVEVAPHHKRAIKVFALCEGAIRHVSIVSSVGYADTYKGGGAAAGPSDATSSVMSGHSKAVHKRRTYLVVAGDDGAVRFFDLKFRIQAWFEDFDSGGVTSVSFSAYLPPTAKGLTLEAPDFVIGTTQGMILGATAALFEELNPAARCGTVVVQGLPGAPVAIGVHKVQPQLVVACETGDVMVWDYELKVLTATRAFEPVKLRPQCLAHHPSGKMLALGFASGALRLVNSTSLEDADVLGGACKPAGSALTMVRFSPGGELLAAADADCHILLWRQEYITVGVIAESQGKSALPELDADSTGNETQQRESWMYIGRHRSHSGPITGLEFGLLEDGSLSLASIGADRRLVEYDIANSTPETGLLLSDGAHFLEESAVPTAIMWHPLLQGDFEDRIVTANDEFKFKQWNASNKGCRRTSLGPAFGGPVEQIIQICVPVDGELLSQPSGYTAYATGERVVGLLKLPLDGNPNHSMGLVAHPGVISSMAVDGDGTVLFTAGGPDLTINAWLIDTATMDAQTQASESDIEAFIELLPGGRDGTLYEELIDYFYYSQLRTQGEDCTDERQASADAKVALSEIPFLMRALGCYPTEQEINNMISEVKYSEFTKTGEVLTELDLAGFIRLFVNHRPLYPVGKGMLAEAFRALGADDTAEGKLNWPALCDALSAGTKPGTGMGEGELKACLESLIGEGNLRSVDGQPAINAPEFAVKVLGFEDAPIDTVPGEDRAVGC